MKTGIIQLIVLMVVVALTSMASGQAGPPANAPICSPPMLMPLAGPMMRGPGMGPRGGPGMGPGMGLGGPALGKWWTNSALVKKLGLTKGQVDKIESVFQQYRGQLLDAHTTLAKQEAALDPLIDAARPDVGQVTAQIDRIAQSRANLEKANAQMLLAIRQVLTLSQWNQLRGGM